MTTPLPRQRRAYKRPSLWARLRLGAAILRGREYWTDGYPTPWAYERVCEALNKERYGCR